MTLRTARTISAFFIALLLAAALPEAHAQDGPIPVEVVKTKTGWQLLRGGEPFVIKGGCIVRGTVEDPELLELLDEIRDAGGNCIRLWATGAGTMGILDAAHERGLGVMLGLWMLHTAGHVDSSGSSFDYQDPEAVTEQINSIALQVALYRDHPALVAWGVGNELEHLTEAADNDQDMVAAIWQAIDDTAFMVKRLDPNHPTIAVTAELGEWHVTDNATQLATYCDNIDIWGVNAYETLPEIREKIDAGPWDRPYLIPEYGPSGWWSAIRTTWGGRFEHTTTEKAEFYREGWIESIAGQSDRCLGGFTYLWDKLTPPTDSWFMMFGPDMEHSACIDALVEVWSGSPPANLSPDVSGISGVSGLIFDPADPMVLEVEAVDPEGGELTVDWIIGEEIFDETGTYRWNAIGPCNYLETGGGLTLEPTAPLVPGAYRAVALVRDDAGSIGLASTPFFVDGDLPDGQPMPFRIDNKYSTTGFMGAFYTIDLLGIQSPNGPCAGIGHKFTFDPPPIALWAGVAWQYPPNNWGGEPGLMIAPGGEYVEFLAWSDTPGTRVNFFAGSEAADGFEVGIDNVELNLEPTWYQIPLKGIEYTEVAIPFGWVISQAAGGDGEPRDIFIADLNWVGPPPPPPCPPDLSGDRVVNGRDLGLLFVNWFATGEAAGDADLNEDGFVDGQDIAVMLEYWGDCPTTP